MKRISFQTVSMMFVCLTTIPLTMAQETPNLLLFMADDMTFTDLGCYGIRM